MKIINSLDYNLDIYSTSIFLAGPTPRSKDVKSWRDEAIKIFEEKGFDGTLIIPEPFHGDKNAQYEWEWELLKRTSLIMFWVPRNMETMPALTTNVEFGMYINSSKVIYGRPDDSERNTYLDALYKKSYDKEPKNTLEETCQECLRQIQEINDYINNMITRA